MRKLISVAIVFVILIAVLRWLSYAVAADSTDLGPAGATPLTYSCYGPIVATTGQARYETPGQDCQNVSTPYTTLCNANDVAVGVKYVYSSYTDGWGILHTGASCYSLCQNMSLDKSQCSWR